MTATDQVDVLVRDHIALVDHVVTEALMSLPRHVSRDDLFSAAQLGLLRAAQLFDPERGVPFAAFATQRMRGAILDELRRIDWAGRSVRTRARQRDRAQDELAARLGRMPTSAELAAELGITIEELSKADDDVRRSVVLSLSVPTEAGERAEQISGTVTPERVLVSREEASYLRDAVAVLPDRLRTVVVGIFFDERTVADLAAELGVTESRVSQMRGQAMGMLKEALAAAFDPSTVPAPRKPGGAVAARRESYYAAVAANSDFRARLSGSAAADAWASA